MPQRTTPLINGEYYHLFNRSINKEPIFTKSRDCQRAIETVSYYSFENTPLRFSYFLALGVDRRLEIFGSLRTNAKKLVEIVSFSFMPNHFHVLLKQTLEGGISRFMALFQNSYSRYFNTKYRREGHLFRGQFKTVRVEDEEQLLHVHRYIHLNPYASFVVKTLEELEGYNYSSLPEFLGKHEKGICHKEVILSHFPSLKLYKNFIYDQADYQRKLEQIRHLVIE